MHQKALLTIYYSASRLLCLKTFLIFSSRGVSHIAWGGQSLEKEAYQVNYCNRLQKGIKIQGHTVSSPCLQVLVLRPSLQCELVWGPGEGGSVPKGAVKGGHTIQGEDLYICRSLEIFYKGQ